MCGEEHKNTDDFVLCLICECRMHSQCVKKGRDKDEKLLCEECWIDENIVKPLTK